MAHLAGMKKQPLSPFALPMMMTQMAIASWETILHRTAMMALGTCSVAEYTRMTTEKIAAMQSSMAVLARGGSHAAVLAPFVSRSRANARRLRKQS